MIHFRLDPRSGVPTYLQLVNQIRRAVRNGTLRPGTQLPTAREVVAALAINPNTVFKAYTELERSGLVVSRQGQGTFVAKGPLAPLAADLRDRLQRGLQAWLRRAQEAGLDREAVEDLFAAVLDEADRAGVA